MPKLLIKLNNIPDDEAEEIRHLLDENGVDFYETDAGRWGISLAGIWLRDEAALPRAQQLLHEYQLQRTERVRDEYAARYQAGERDSVLHRLFRSPLQIILYLLAILAIIYLTLMPFVQLISD